MRDGEGKPTGILLEKAMELAFPCMAEPSAEAAVAAVRRAQEVVNRMGIVGVHTKEGAASLRAFQQLRAEGDLRLRTVAQIPVAELDNAIRLGLRTGLGDEFLLIGGVKVFSDGALGPRTAWMLAPYDGEPGNLGIAVTGAEEDGGYCRQGHGCGAGGGHARDRRQGKPHGAGCVGGEPPALARGLHLRHRIEHAQVLHPDDIPRFAQLDIIASVQPIHAKQDMLIADRYWGERSRYAYAFRSLWDSGAKLAFGSDAPVETPDVIQGIHAAVTRMRAGRQPRR